MVLFLNIVELLIFALLVLFLHIVVLLIVDLLKRGSITIFSLTPVLPYPTYPTFRVA